MKCSKLAIASAFVASVMSFNSMADNTGSVEFIGSVVNTPCNIEQSSVKQTVDFGQLSRKALEGGNVAEADFNIKFTGCDFNNFDKDEEDNPIAVKSMQLVFTGQNYADAQNTLLATSAGNTNNLGIAIDGFEFGKAKNVLPNGDKQGEVSLSFKALARAVDASKDIVEGKFSAISNFRITYE